MPTSPTVRRRQLIAELKRLRIARHLTIDDVASAIGMSATTLSRIEHGQTGIKTPILRALLATYEVGGDEAARLEALSKEAAQRAWWQVDGPSDAFKTAIGLEAEATWIHLFTNSVVPGLLQTESYARALGQAIHVDGPAADIDRDVTLRMRRQERVGELGLTVISGEETLLRAIGGPAVMAGQIDRLLEASEESRIDLRIVGREAGEHVGLAGSFEIIGLRAETPEAVYVEGAHWHSIIDAPGQLTAYVRSFERLRHVALSPEESRARLRSIRIDYT